MTVALTAIDSAGNRRTTRYSPAAKLGRGGAGTVFADETDKKYVLKIYNELLDAQLSLNGAAAAPRDEASRIAAMLGAAPANQIALAQNASNIPWSQRSGPVVQIAWPQEALYDAGGRFVGFTMLAVDRDKTEPIESLFEIASRRDIAKKYSLGDHTTFNYAYRLNVCRNLAALLQSVHDAGHAACDLNPQNVKIYINRGLACLIDCDGFRIEVAGKVYPCPKMLDEIAAPEIFAAAGGFDPKVADKRQDLFAFGLLVFRMLNDGKSPYHVVGQNAHFVLPGTMPERIKAGLYGYGLHKNAAVDAAPGSLHDVWPPDLRRFFDLCFAPGGDPRLRPSAQDWLALLDKLSASARNCKLHGPGSKLNGKRCVYCERDSSAKPKAQVPMPPGKPSAPLGSSPAPPVPSGFRRPIVRYVVIGCLVLAGPSVIKWLSQPKTEPIAWRAPAPYLPRPSPPVVPSYKPDSFSSPATKLPEAPRIEQTDSAIGTTAPLNESDEALSLVVLGIQEQLRDLKVGANAPPGIFDGRTRNALAALGIPVNDAPTVAQLQQAAASLDAVKARQAANMRRGPKYMMSRRFSSAAFAALDEEDMQVIAYTVDQSLKTLARGQIIKTALAASGAYVEVMMRPPPPEENCKLFNMTINKHGASWTVKGIRACGGPKHWRLER